jgi:asparagine synthase (glutamine-hydrolysing)
MCGILGSYKNSKINTLLFENQLNAIRHRGPDDGGVWFSDDAKIALGSRRLAIQDLSSNGHMPMISKNQDYILVFNGEIYNYLELKKSLESLGFKFYSNSDTECVLNAFIAWGKDCLQHFNGMFSIAIFDKQQNQLFIARDRAGEKPLYYWNHKDGFSFSSELKQLLIDEELPKELSKIAVKQYLEDGFVKGQFSFIQGVLKLPAAHYLIYDINKMSLNITKYWDVPNFVKNSLDKNDLIEKLDHLLSKAVGRQMISDVPLGVLLSGGVDSSLITSYAVENTSKLKTFHISFNGFGKYDESEYARQVANYFDTEHYELSGNEINYEMIDELLDFYDEPLGDSSMLPTYLVSKLTKTHVTVALGGDGGDELFGGYSSYFSLLNQSDFSKNTPYLVTNLVKYVGSKLPVGFKGRNYLISLFGNPYERFSNNRLFDDYSLKDIFTKDYFEKIKNLNSKPEIEISGDLIYDLTKYDFKNYLVDDILVKVDRASMGSSLELRAPFLDKDVIEFAFSELKSDLKVNNNNLKILLKDLLKRRMPIDFQVNRKQGFSIPLNQWISDKWHSQFINEINDLPAIFNKEYILKMCYNVKRGYTNSSKLYSLIILGKWLKKYNITNYG